MWLRDDHNGGVLGNRGPSSRRDRPNARIPLSVDGRRWGKTSQPDVSQGGYMFPENACLCELYLIQSMLNILYFCKFQFFKACRVHIVAR